MRILFSALALAALTACGAEWTAIDLDGDGSPFGEDCNENDPNIGPGVAEIWYDGVDQNCDGNDADKDGDGYVPAGLDYDWTDFPAHVAEGDCWDDPDLTPAGMGTVAGFAVITAADVHVDATDTWYDGPDQDCGGNSDFDQDGDGFDSAGDVQADGSYGDDCADGSVADDAMDLRCVLEGEYDSLDELLAAVGLTTADVNPAATDSFYDGLDQDCAGDSDWDSDGDTYDRCDECDDDNELKYPDDSVEELWYNCEDENCDGNDGDQDLDGFVSDEYVATCPNWADFTSHFETGDCWDDDVATTDIPTEMDAINGGTQRDPSEVYPGASDDPYDDVDSACDGDTYEFDADEDGYDDSENPDRGGSTGQDCDDAEASTYPNASELCDDVDSDCDDDLNDINSTGCTTYYYDGDLDGYGDVASSEACYCEPHATNLYTSTTNDDCDDSTNDDHPGATEHIADGDDEDCDGFDTCYVDADKDSYGDEDGSTVVSSDLSCKKNRGEANDTEDCDDSDSDTYPGAATAASTTACMNDDDGDGYGDDTVSGSVVAGTDCDDTTAAVNPGETDTVANGVDDDCDSKEQCYVDDDGDTYGDDDESQVASSDLDCTDSGESEVATDCKDNNADAFPGSAELESTTACMEDADNDGYGDESPPSGVDPGTDCDDSTASTNPGATEGVADGLDQDCNGNELCYEDLDFDDYGTTNTVTSGNLDCNSNGESEVSTDCYDDASLGDQTFPGAAETDSSTACMQDDDEDGYGDDTPPSGVTAGTDCDDSSDEDYPGATETVANGDDEDCDGGDTCYDDNDLDGYGSTSTVTSADLDCADSGESSVDTDCLDTNIYAFPGSAEAESSTSCREDADGDGYGDDTPPSGVTAGDDCDDGDSAINPGEDEICDGSDTDEDCNGVADDDDSGALSSGKTSTYVDDDGDGEGDDGASVTKWCDVPSGYVTNNDDCDDSDADVNTSATEVTADGVDNDCDGNEQCYVDSDGDDYGSTSTVASSNLVCTNSGEADNDDDCDDGDADTYPGAAASDSGTSCMNDDDGDGYGDDTVSGSVVAGTDCDDGDGDTYPGAAANDSSSQCMTDADGDGWGDDSAGSGVTNGTDCDDSDSGVSPDGTENAADGIDQDCDDVDDCYTDTDGDGYGGSTTQTGSDLTCGNGDEADDSDDCDDGDAYTYPGAAASDSTSDCMTDADGDGWGDDAATGDVTAGTDCDDSDSGISPDESGNDDRGTLGTANVDDDCDDIVDEDYAWAGGELVISEVHYYSELANPKNGEWLELYNPSATETYYLDGWTVDLETTGSDQDFVIGVDGLVIGPESYVVLCYKSAVLASAGCDYEYGGNVDNGSSDAGSTDNDAARVADTGDDIEISVGGVTIDALSYDNGTNFPTIAVTGDGYSIELDASSLDATSNDDGANWCKSEAADEYYNSSGIKEKGTPQAAAGCTPP